MKITHFIFDLMRHFGGNVCPIRHSVVTNSSGLLVNNISYFASSNSHYNPTHANCEPYCLFLCEILWKFIRERQMKIDGKRNSNSTASVSNMWRNNRRFVNVNSWKF